MAPSRMSMARLFAGKALQSLFDPSMARQLYGMTMGIYPGGRGEPPKKGTRQFLEAYSTMPWLRAAVDRIGTSCASVTYRLYVPTDNAAPADGRSNRPTTVVTIGSRKFQVPIYSRSLGDRLKQRPHRGVQLARSKERTKSLEELADSGKLRAVEEHPLLDLLQGTTGYLVGSSIRKLLQIHLDTVGDAFWLKQRNEMGMPVAVWPLPPDWVVELPQPGKAYYRVSFRGWQGEIPETEILWFSDPDPANPYSHGSGIARALADELDTDEATAKHIRRFFFNGGRPDVLVAGEGLTQENTTQLESAWMARSREFWKQGLPFFMNEKVQIQELGKSFKDMDLVPLREHERDIIINTIGIPPEVLGIIQNSNRATIDAAAYLMGIYVTVPRLEFSREVMQTRLVPEYDPRLILDYDNPVQEDKDFHLRAMIAKPETPTADEWREIQGLEPLPDGEGDLHMVTMGTSAAKKLSDLLPEAVPASLRPPPAGGDGQQPPQLEPGQDPANQEPANLPAGDTTP
jgi:hypothetical protein